MGNRIRKICLLVLKMGDPRASMNLPAEERSGYGECLMSGGLVSGYKFRFLWRKWYTELALTVAACCCYPALGPWALFPLPDSLLLLESIPCGVYQHDAEVGHASFSYICDLWCTCFSVHLSLPRRTWIPGTRVYIFDYVITTVWISGCSLRDASTFTETERLCSIFLFRILQVHVWRDMHLHACMLSLSVASESLWLHGL